MNREKLFYCLGLHIVKGNKPVVNRAKLGKHQLILKVFGQTCAAFFFIVFMLCILHSVIDRESIESTSYEKQI